ncbi:MAG: ABC transporter ATP-binding protein [Nitrospinota bacterium]
MKGSSGLNRDVAPGLVVRGISAKLGARTVIQEVNLSVPPGRLVAAIGPNGAGKTSLLRCIAGVLRPSFGSVLLDGGDLLSMPERQRARLVAYLPQEAHVTFPFTALEVVLMGRHPHLGWLAGESPLDLEIAREALDEVDALELAGRPVTQLSGGERRRVLFARALAQKPRLLLLDEPTADQDLHHALLLMERCRRDAETCVLAVLHDLNLAGRFSDRLLLLNEGRAFAEGESSEVLHPDVLNPVYRVAVTVITDGRHRMVVPDRLPTSGREGS